MKATNLRSILLKATALALCFVLVGAIAPIKVFSSGNAYANFLFRSLDVGHFSADPGYNTIFPATIAINRDGVRAYTVTTDRWGDASLTTRVPGYYTATIIYAPNHHLSGEVRSLGYFDGTTIFGDVVFFQLEPSIVRPVRHVPVWSYLDIRLLDSSTTRAIRTTNIAIYRDDEYVQTVRRTCYLFFVATFRTSVAGNYFARVSYAPGYTLTGERIPLGSLDGVTSVERLIEITLEPAGLSASTTTPSTTTPPFTAPQPTSANTLHVIGAPPGGHPVAIINGNGLQVNPVIRNGNTLVPLRAIADAFGAEVSWSGVLQQITIYMPTGNVYLTIGSTTVRGANIPLSIAPLNENGTVFMPARFFAYLFGADVTFAHYPG